MWVRRQRQGDQAAFGLTMARLLLDTTVLIDALRGRPAATRVAGLRRVGTEPWACAISVEEIWRGLRPGEELSARRLFNGLRLAPLGAAEGMRAGSWRRSYANRGVTLHQADCLVAAAAAGVGAALATANVEDFPHERNRRSALADRSVSSPKRTGRTRPGGGHSLSLRSRRRAARRDRERDRGSAGDAAARRAGRRRLGSAESEHRPPGTAASLSRCSAPRATRRSRCSRRSGSRPRTPRAASRTSAASSSCTTARPECRWRFSTRRTSPRVRHRRHLARRRPASRPPRIEVHRLHRVRRAGGQPSRRARIGAAHRAHRRIQPPARERGGRCARTHGSRVSWVGVTHGRRRCDLGRRHSWSPRSRTDRACGPSSTPASWPPARSRSARTWAAPGFPRPSPRSTASRSTIFRRHASAPMVTAVPVHADLVTLIGESRRTDRADRAAFMFAGIGFGDLAAASICLQRGAGTRRGSDAGALARVAPWIDKACGAVPGSAGILPA